MTNTNPNNLDYRPEPYKYVLSYIDLNTNKRVEEYFSGPFNLQVAFFQVMSKYATPTYFKDSKTVTKTIRTNKAIVTVDHNRAKKTLDEYLCKGFITEPDEIKVEPIVTRTVTYNESNAEVAHRVQLKINFVGPNKEKGGELNYVGW